MNKEDLEAMGINSQSKHSKNRNVEENRVASIIKTFAIIGAILGIFASFMIKDLTIMIIMVSVISAIFIYAFGEIIDLLQKVVNNTNK